MAKMRATLRKVMTQVTPPPSPKNNGEDVIKSETWSSRLRNNQTRSCSGVVRDLRRKGRSRLPLTSTPKVVPSTVVVKKEPRDVYHHNDDSNCSHSSDVSAPSPVCNGRMRTRQSSGESPTSASYWPRRSARLIGIPAETVDLEETSKKANGSLSHEEEDDEEEEEEEQHQDDPPVAVAVNGDAAVTEDQCGNCKEQQQRKRRNTGRGIEALLAEGEHFMHYPASPTSRGRSTYNSSTHRERVDSSASIELTQSPSPERPPQPPPAPLGPLPESVHQVQFSFEMVPSGTIWYQTFLRDEEQQDDRPPPLDEFQTAPFLLPYEMSLETILKSNRAVRKKATTAKRKTKAERAAAAGPTFRPIISTRLQMQAAAAAAADTVTAGCSRQQQQHTATSSSCSSGDEMAARKRRRPGKPPNSRWMLPRKSPRCHASTMALICSKSDDDEAALIAAAVQDTQEDPPVAQVPAAVQKVHHIPVQEDNNELVRLLKEMLTQGLDRRPDSKEEEEEPSPQPPPKKRGRPRKYPRPEESIPAPILKTKKKTTTEAPLVHLLDTPLDRIGDIVDECLLHQQPDDETMQLSFSDDNNLPVWTAEEDVFHDVDSSSSVYETASEVGSTSTGTCDSQRVSSANSSESRQRNGHHRHHHRRGHHGHRRKRPNMTGWPRSKKPRRPALLTLEDDLLPICIATDEDDEEGEDEDEDDFGPPPVLTPIREESSSLLLSSSAVSNAPPSSCGGSSSNGYVMRNKPFQFQRKTLRFVGKRILRPAAQRSAPQRLQYWPCFPSSSSSTSGSKSSSGAGGGSSGRSNGGPLRSGRKPRA